ncbi:MAG: 4Fe-4S binding protein [Deltaproteobacteria bacterium]|nr:MAG: 4Fe-4S binding protein [Deltaproteobacteria bacterium]
MRFSKYVVLKDRCKNCGACLEVCPDDAIMRTERDVCEIDEDLCSFCGMCMEVCQVQAVKKALSASVFLKSLLFAKEVRYSVHV